MSSEVEKSFILTPEAERNTSLIGDTPCPIKKTLHVFSQTAAMLPNNSPLATSLGPCKCIWNTKFKSK